MQRYVAALAADGVEHHDALRLVGVVGKTEGIGGAGVPNARRHFGVEMVMPEQYEVRLERGQVDLDLVYVCVARLPLA